MEDHANLSRAALLNSAALELAATRRLGMGKAMLYQKLKECCRGCFQV